MTINENVGAFNKRFVFRNYAGPKSLPQDPHYLDQLVKYAVVQLSENPTKAERILKNASPDKSANYLVVALRNQSIQDIVVRLLKSYPVNVTNMPLVRALGDATRRDVATEILLYRGRERLEDLRKELMSHSKATFYEPLDKVINSIETQLN